MYVCTCMHIATHTYKHIPIARTSLEAEGMRKQLGSLSIYSPMHLRTDGRVIICMHACARQVVEKLLPGIRDSTKAAKSTGWLYSLKPGIYEERSSRQNNNESFNKL